MVQSESSGVPVGAQARTKAREVQEWLEVAHNEQVTDAESLRIVAAFEAISTRALWADQHAPQLDALVEQRQVRLLPARRL